VLRGPSDPLCIADVGFKVIEAEIAGVVDHLEPLFEKGASFFLPHAVRCSEQDHIEISGTAQGIEFHQGQVAEALQMGIQVTDGGAQVLLVNEDPNLRLRMIEQKLYGPTAPIAASTNNRYLDLFHANISSMIYRQKILIQQYNAHTPGVQFRNVPFFF
jgi:hypothetical protein